jgi:hypothetical protein
MDGIDIQSQKTNE